MADETFHHGVMKKNENVAFERFELRNGQFFGKYLFKNLWWVLNGETIGYGDLTWHNLLTIQTALEKDEAFIGWNENHGTEWQQMSVPMVRVTKKSITFPYRDART